MSADDPAFDASGHLSELTLDRLHLDPPESAPDLFARAAGHLEACARCRAELDDRAARDRAFTLAPPAALAIPPAVSPAAPSARTSPAAARARRAWFAGGGAALAIAAGLVIATRTPTPDPSDGVRLKGGLVELTVEIHDGTAARVARDGEPVRPGDRAGFALRAREPGFAVLVAWSDDGPAAALWPNATAPVGATAVAATPEAVTLPVATRLDAAPVVEHVAVVYCREPFTLDALAGVAPGAAVRAAAIREALARPEATLPAARFGGCAWRELALDKRGAPR